MGMFRWLFGGTGASRDGSSPEKAVLVGSIPEEYQWIQRHCPGFRFEMQALREIDGKRYDVLMLRDDRGNQREVYFDISSFFGK